MAGATRNDAHQAGRRNCSRFRVTRHIFIENLEDKSKSSKQVNDLRQSRRDITLYSDRDEDRSDSDSLSDDGRDCQLNRQQNGRRVSWAEELVTVHEYIKDRREVRFSFACLPIRLSI